MAENTAIMVSRIALRLVGTHARPLYPVVALVIALALSTVEASAPVHNELLAVPHRSQIDGTVWGASNCGPASIAMVLAAYSLDVPNNTLRDRANQLMGIVNPRGGTHIQDLARIVREHGLATNGPYQGNAFRRWTLDDVRREVLAGRPVIPQVYYPFLPNHRERPVVTDHYIVIVGVSGEDFIYNDPADRHHPGYRLKMTAAEFQRAWRASNRPFVAFSVGPDAIGRPVPPVPESIVRFVTLPYPI